MALPLPSLNGLRAFEAAEELVRAGVVPGDVSLWINESVTQGSVKLLGLCLTTMEVHANGAIATIELPNRHHLLGLNRGFRRRHHPQLRPVTAGSEP